MAGKNFQVGVKYKGFDLISKPLKNINRRMKKFRDRMKKTRKTAKKTASSIGNSFNNIALSVAGALIGIRAFRAAFTGILDTANEASAFIEQNQKFGVVFRGLSKEADSMRETLVDAYNFSKIEATELLSTTGDLLVGIGFQRKEALKMSFALNKLAADRASFTDLEGGARRASMAMTKALLGERESLKGLGLSVIEGSDSFKKALKLAKKNKKNTLEQAKAIATFSVILQKSADSVGDVARNQDVYATKLRDATAKISDMKVEIGLGLLPPLTLLLSKFTIGAKIVANFARENQAAIGNEFISGLQLSIKLVSLLTRFVGGLGVGFKLAQFAWSKLQKVVLNGIAFMLDGFSTLPGFVGNIFGFLAKIVSTQLSLILDGVSLVVGVFDEDFAKSIDNTSQMISEMGSNFDETFKNAQKGSVGLAADLRDLAKGSSMAADDFFEDALTIGAGTLKVEKVLDNVITKLDTLRRPEGDQKTTPQVVRNAEDESTADNLQGITPSPSAVSAAQIKGRIDVNFNNKPDDVTVIRPQPDASPGLVLSGSG